MASPVVITAIPSQSTVLAGVKQSAVVMLELQAPSASQEEQRQPFELCILMDRSGSMAGSCLRKAKAAICSVIDALERDDVLHLVVYDTRATVVFQNGCLTRRESLKEQVRAIQTGGNTSISCGLEVAAQTFRASTGQQRQQRIFLYSDGRPNAGHTSAADLSALTASLRQTNGIVTCAYGIGSDFDESVMQGIAAGGGGRYAPVDKRGIKRVTQQAMEDLLSVVGTDARLNVRGLNGAVVTEVLGYPQEDLVAGLDLKDLHSGSCKKLLVRLDVAPAVPSPDLEILQFTLRYSPALPGGHSSAAHPVPKEVVMDTATVAVSDGSSPLPPVDPRVAVALALHTAADVVDNVAEDLEEGEVPQAIGRLQQCAAALEAQCEHDADGAVAVVLGRVQRMLERLQVADDSRDFGLEIRRAHHYGQIQRNLSQNELYRCFSPTASEGELSRDSSYDAGAFTPRAHDHWHSPPLSPISRSWGGSPVPWHRNDPVPFVTDADGVAYGVPLVVEDGAVAPDPTPASPPQGCFGLSRFVGSLFRTRNGA